MTAYIKREIEKTVYFSSLMGTLTLSIEYRLLYFLIIYNLEINGLSVNILLFPKSFFFFEVSRL